MLVTVMVFLGLEGRIEFLLEFFRAEGHVGSNASESLLGVGRHTPRSPVDLTLLDLREAESLQVVVVLKDVRGHSVDFVGVPRHLLMEH